MRFEFLLLRQPSKPAQNLIISSNDRFHHKPQAVMTRRLRMIAKAEASQWTLPEPYYTPEDPCTVRVTVYPPTKRRMDPPNVYPTVKALIDGLTDAKIWSDDNHEVIEELAFRYGGLSGEKNKYRLIIDIE